MEKHILITEILNKHSKDSDFYLQNESYSTRKDYETIHITDGNSKVDSQGINNNDNKIKAESYFKNKTSFDLPKNKLLDYFISNHTEYVDLSKYESYYETCFKKNKSLLSSVNSQIQERKKYLESLEVEINEKILDRFHISEKILVDQYKDSIDSILDNLENYEYDLKTYESQKADLISLNVS